ncbi:MAG TPA: TAXI family TRAP transporter solute-binding subunit [Acetobacteraceae bacterium]|nr:TAXI family TRAP transporter solute-binding subunit [Acetobacteraceae bacterium]
MYRARRSERSFFVLGTKFGRADILLIFDRGERYASKGTNVMKLILALLWVLLAVPAFAQQPQVLISRANQGTVGVITGMEGGTYARTAADLTILDSDSLRVLPTLGKGSLQNLSDILYLKGIDIGFVQADALTYAKRHNLFPNLAQGIQYIAKLYNEEIHVLARKDIKTLKDLNGQRVNVDVIGSGSAMTAEIVLSELGINAKIEHEKQVTGVEELKRGDIAAIIHVGGAPIPLFADIPSASGIHFLPIAIDQALLSQTYLPAEFTHQTYPLLVPEGASVPTIAVGDVMAVYAWAPHTERYNKVARFVDAFFSHFDEFQKPPRHPKWREVNLAAQVPGWTRFAPAQEWLDQRAATVAANDNLQQDFNRFVAVKISSGEITPSERDTLFKEFLQWRRQQ